MRIIFILLLSVLTFVSCSKDDDNNSQNSTVWVEVESLEHLQNTVKIGSSLVFYYSPSCSICNRQRPIIESLMDKSELKEITFLRVNNDNHSHLAQVMGVHGHPVIVFYKNGSENSRITGGGHDAQKIKNILLNLLEE